MLKCLPLSCPQVCNKIIFLMSFVGNCGTFTRGYRAMVLDVEFLYHLLYLLICALGLFVHEFFYSLLVSPRAPRANQRVRAPHPWPLLLVLALTRGYFSHGF